MSTPAIELRGLRKSFGDLEVLRGVDLAIDARQVVCVIGASGSGKSTLLRCVNRLEEPTGGQVLIDGTDITHPLCDVDLVRRKIGMVFQQFNLFPHLKVLANVTLAQRRVLGRSKAEADEVLGTCAPPPTLRWSTGGGEHLEWLFGDPILILNDEHRANLQQLSNDWHSHLAESFRRAGLHFDQTGDLARHLRLVGTHRRKGGTEHRVTLCPHLEYPTGGVFKPDGSIDRTWRPENVYGAAELEGGARLRLAPSPGLPPPPPSRRRYTSQIDGSAADTVSEQYSWGDILGPQGWHYVSGTDPQLWHRGDGASSEYSLKAWEHACVVWSSAAGLPHGKGQRLSKFRLLAHMRFGGNESACGRAVRRWMNEGGARP